MCPQFSNIQAVLIENYYFYGYLVLLLMPRAMDFSSIPREYTLMTVAVRTN